MRLVIDQDRVYCDNNTLTEEVDVHKSLNIIAYYLSLNCVSSNSSYLASHMVIDDCSSVSESEEPRMRFHVDIAQSHSPLNVTNIV